MGMVIDCAPSESAAFGGTEGAQLRNALLRNGYATFSIPATKGVGRTTAVGVPHDVAVPHGTSRKAYWRLAETLGGHMGIGRGRQRVSGVG